MNNIDWTHLVQLDSATKMSNEQMQNSILATQDYAGLFLKPLILFIWCILVTDCSNYCTQPKHSTFEEFRSPSKISCHYLWLSKTLIFHKNESNLLRSNLAHKKAQGWNYFSVGRLHQHWTNFLDPIKDVEDQIKVSKWTKWDFLSAY